jgi:hypothetical protein
MAPPTSLDGGPEGGHRAPSTLVVQVPSPCARPWSGSPAVNCATGADRTEDQPGDRRGQRAAASTRGGTFRGEAPGGQAARAAEGRCHRGSARRRRWRRVRAWRRRGSCATGRQRGAIPHVPAPITSRSATVGRDASSVSTVRCPTCRPSGVNNPEGATEAGRPHVLRPAERLRSGHGQVGVPGAAGLAGSDRDEYGQQG